MNKRNLAIVNRKKDEDTLAYSFGQDPEQNPANETAGDGFDGWPYGPSRSSRLHPGFNYYVNSPDGEVAFNEFPRDLDHCREMALRNYFMDGAVSRPEERE